MGSEARFLSRSSWQGPRSMQRRWNGAATKIWHRLKSREDSCCWMNCRAMLWEKYKSIYCSEKASDKMSAKYDIGTINEAEQRRQLRHAVLASTIGTAIEWYDFFLYSTVTGLVFARLYFPRADPFVGTLEAFGVYAVGFLARPIGAAIFGHYGDRLGRKAALITTDRKSV